MHGLFHSLILLSWSLCLLLGKSILHMKTVHFDEKKSYLHRISLRYREPVKGRKDKFGGLEKKGKMAIELLFSILAILPIEPKKAKKILKFRLLGRCELLNAMEALISFSTIFSSNRGLCVYLFICIHIFSTRNS